MRSRGIVVVLALILATLATAGVFLYSRGVKQDALEGGEVVQVIVAKVDIPANSDLSALIAQEQFALQELPADAVIEDATLYQYSAFHKARDFQKFAAFAKVFLESQAK